MLINCIYSVETIQSFMWIYAYGFFLLYLSKADGACTDLPLIGNWTYNDDLAFSWTFTNKSLSGFTLSGKGTQLSSYYCIASNAANVYVFKSTYPYSDRGNDRWLYLCMKITKVSDNLFYFYFLNDIENSGTVSPQERVYNPAANAVPRDDLPACDYCKYTTSPPDSDKRKLAKQGTNEALSGLEKLCVPCDRTCNTIDCKPPPSVNNSINVSTGNKSGDNVTYTCKSGFQHLSGNLSRTCQSDSSWSGENPFCAAIVCPVPPDIDHSTNVTFGKNPGHNITYICNNGFERTSGDLTRTCQNDKTWSGSPPVCTVKPNTTDANVAIIAPAAVGSIVVAALIIFASFTLFRMRKNKKNRTKNIDEIYA